MATYKTVTVDASGADYTSVLDAIEGEIVIQSDLVTAGGDLIIQVQDGYEDAIEVFNVTGSFTTDANSRVIIEGASPLLKMGWDTARARMLKDGGQNALIYNDFCNDLVIRDLQLRDISDPSFTNRYLIQDLALNGTILIERCVLIGDGTPTATVNLLHFDNAMNSKIMRDCLIFSDGAWNHAIQNGDSQLQLQNVTIDGFSGAPTNNTLNGSVLGTNVRVTNCGAIDGADWDTGSDYNLTDEVGAPAAFLGTNGVDSATLAYVDAANATLTARDYAIGATDDGYEAGVVISGHPGTDLLGVSRTTPWDIGAHEASTGAGGGGTGTIRRTNSGLLAVYIAGDANFPFNESDWEAGKNTTSTAVDGATGRLILTPNGIGYWRHSGVGASSRSKRMVQAVVRTVSPGNNDYVNVGGHMEAGAGTHDDIAGAGLAIEDDGLNRGFFIGERDDDVKVSGTDGSLPYKSHDTDYRVSAFLDSSAMTAHDFDQTETLTHTLTNIASGHAGFTQCCSTRPAEVSEFWDCEGRLIICTGLPTGHKLKVRGSGGTILKTATESGGTATIDMIDAVLPDIVDVVVTDGADVAVSAPFTPDGVNDPWIAGGDTFEFSFGIVKTVNESLNI